MKILEVQGLTKAYGDKKGLFDFDLSLNDGEILLLLGPNGAGKTTFFKSILGLTSCDASKIELMGEPITINHMASIGAMVSSPSPYEYMTAFKYLKIFQQMYDLDETRIDEVLTMVGLSHEKHTKIRTFSTGMKQRLDFARAIIHKPKLLILDEPFSGMDIEAKAQFKELLKDFKESGIIISSHMAENFVTISNKLVIIYKGKTLFSGDMTEIEKSNMSLESFYLSKIKGLKEVV